MPICFSRYLLPVVFSFAFLIPLHAQRVSRVDVIDSLNTTSEAVRYSSPALAATLAQQALALSARDPKLKIQKVTAQVNWSYALAESGALDSAAILADSAEVSAAGIKDSSVRSSLLVLHGYICDYQEKNEEALNYYFNGLSLCPDLKYRAAICNNIGSVYKLMNDLDNAAKYYEMSYLIGVDMGDSIRQARCLNNLGGVSYSRQDLPGALQRYRESLRIREALRDSAGMSSSLSNIAMVYEKMDKPDSALLLYRQSLNLDLSSNRPVGIVISHMNIGNLLFQMKRKDEAFVQLQRAATLSDSLHIHYYSRLAHRSLANYYAETGDYRNAYTNYVLYAAYNDSVLTERSQKNVQELELRYRTRESAQQIKLLEEQRRIDVLEKENSVNQLGRQRSLLWIVVLAALVIILFTVLLLQRYRASRKQAGELERLVGEKDLLLREIHHRVKNNLQLVSSLLSLQEGTGAGNGGEVLKQSRDRIHTLALLHEKLYQSSDLKAISLREYVQLLVDFIGSSFNASANNIKLNCKVEDTPMDIDQLVPCGLIINELVTNCFKHAFPSGGGTITVEASIQKEQLTLSVSDDGIGMTDAQQQRSGSLGLKLVKGLSRQLRAEVRSESFPSQGSAFHITFRLHEHS